MNHLRSLPGRAAVGILALAVVFLAGAAAGAALDRHFLLRIPVEYVARQGAGADRDGERSPQVRRALETGIPVAMLQLQLTPEQQATLTEIAKRRRPRADSVMRALRPVVGGLETQMMQEMLCALSPAQQSHWLALMDTMKFSPEVVAERYRPVREHTCDAVGK